MRFATKPLQMSFTTLIVTCELKFCIPGTSDCEADGGLYRGNWRVGPPGACNVELAPGAK